MRKLSSTTRGSSRRTSRNKFFFRLTLVLVAILVLLLLIPRVISGVGYVVMTPVDGLVRWFENSTSALPTAFRDRQKLETEISELEQRNAELQTNNLALRTLQNQNSELLALYDSRDPDRVVAEVIGRPPTTPYDLLQLDLGSEDGIKVGAPVFVGNNQVIGVVNHTNPHTAFVEMITSPGFETTVYVYGPNIYTNAEGYGGGVVRVSVPQGITLATDNIVTVPALESGIFGSITHIETSPTQPEQYGYVLPAIPIQQISRVAVGKSPVPEVDFETVKNRVAINTPHHLKINIPEDQLTSVASSSATSTEP